MAPSTCVKCGHTSFEIAESAIAGLRFKRDFLQCGQCGGVIGVIEAENLNTRLDAIEARLKELAGTHTSQERPAAGRALALKRHAGA